MTESFETLKTKIDHKYKHYPELIGSTFSIAFVLDNKESKINF